jgi:hypothetical protein
MKRTIQIEDTLQERIDSAIADVKQALQDYLEENQDTDKLPDINDELDYRGGIHEIIDGSVPIYTDEINATMFLYGARIEEAFDDAGIGGKDSDWPNGWQAAAIYCYIQAQVNEWYSDNAQGIFDDWQESKEEAAAPATA